MKYVKTKTDTVQFMRTLNEITEMYKKYRLTMIRKDAIKKCAGLYKKSKIKLIDAESKKEMSRLDIIKFIDSKLDSLWEYESELYAKKNMY